MDLNPIEYRQRYLIHPRLLAGDRVSERCVALTS